MTDDHSNPLASAASAIREAWHRDPNAPPRPKPAKSADPDAEQESRDRMDATWFATHKVRGSVLPAIDRTGDISDAALGPRKVSEPWERPDRRPVITVNEPST